MPKDALLNDVNPHLINFYKWLQKGFEISLRMKNDEKIFYSYRKKFNELVEEGKSDTKEAAVLFYYLNRTGFNGLCRFNTKGKFNVPFGEHKIINYKYDFSEYKKKLENWKFICSDFEKVSVKTSDLIYVDPPYDVKFTKYAKEGFTWDDQVRLAKWLSKLKNPIVVSNQATERIIDLYASYGFDFIFVDAPRRISCTGDRTPAKEIIATKNI